MTRFRKKPVEIEALQFTGVNFDAIREFVGLIDGRHEFGFKPTEGALPSGNIAWVWDKLHDTWVGVKKNQWIIKGIKGEFYPCDDEVMHSSYDPVED